MLADAVLLPYCGIPADDELEPMPVADEEDWSWLDEAEEDPYCGMLTVDEDITADEDGTAALDVTDTVLDPYCGIPDEETD